MILLDANILLYAYNTDAPEHVRAAEWLKRAFEEERQIGIPWQTAWAFVRLSTSSRIYQTPFEPGAALKVLRSWMEWETVQMLTPGSRHLAYLELAMVDGRVTGALTSDAVLAALAMEYGATLISTDRDFARFPQLKWQNPLG